MIIQVVNFNLSGLTDAEYRGLSDKLAPELSRVPGLLSKVWLADERSNTYGGVYTWASQEALDAFARSDFFQAFITNPSFANIRASVYDVMVGPSEVTRGSLPLAA